MEKKKTCFIVCPISDEKSDIRKRSDQLFNHILEPVCNELGFEVIRIDKLPHNNSITAEIIKYLKEVDLVIGDTTDNNPNCFYEIGYRAAISKPLILIRNAGQKLPFDISGINSLEYNLNDLDEAEKFKGILKDNIKVLDFAKFHEEEQDLQNSNENLNSILQLLLNLNSKIDQMIKDNNTYSLNQASLHRLLAEIVLKKNEQVPKTQDEVMLEFIKEIMKNPEGMKALVDFGKSIE